MAVSLQTLVKILATVEGQEKLEQFQKSLEKTKKESFSLRDGLKLLAGALAVQQFVAYAKSILDTADNLRDLAQKTGFSVQGLSDLKAAAEDGGSSFEQLQGNLRKFTIGLAESIDQESKSAKALKAMGIVANDSNKNFKDSNAVLLQVADRFAKMKDGADKSKLAVDLFGKSGAEMIPILNGGAEAIRGLGVAFSDDFADRSDQFNDSLNQVSRGLQTLFVKGLDSLLPTLQELVQVFTNLPKDLDGALSFFDVIGEGLRAIAIGANIVKEAFLQLVDTLMLFGKLSVDALSTSYKEIKNFLTGNSKLNEGSEAAFNKRADEQVQAFVDRAKKRAEGVVDFTQKLTFNSKVFGVGEVDDIRSRERFTTKPKKEKAKTEQAPEINKALDDQAKKEKTLRDAIDDKVRSIELETSALGLSNEEKVRAADLIELENKGVEKGSELYGELAEKLGEARDRQEELNAQFEADPFNGAKAALDGYIENVKNMAALTQSAVSRSLSSLEDTFVDFFMTGKFQWKEFGKVIIEEITRIAVKKAIIAPLVELGSSILGFEEGGVMSSAGEVPLRKYARGGVADSPQMALFGEGSKPEAFVPLNDGRTIPVTVKGQKGGEGSVNVTVNVSSSGSVDASGGKEDQKNFGLAIAQVVKAEIVKQKRAGGLLAGGA